MAATPNRNALHSALLYTVLFDGCHGVPGGDTVTVKIVIVNGHVIVIR